mmetsp:Transcript_20218/g.22596  ORF Transcript_20218/g.22596 Transcript_20218/m.22596 type:complete len:406 (+) Transcript_20218:373-1590(+)|eukprot:CAMPEP_0194154596 /NCGR_PEP_ID=MMETSP0152-20130528/61285_1 /TAXON_ID=1049557 /ORGANISM="Thalassiothrix antarctica, Strain L6-D1" /LENGTH=405 /DNA_ID=CAMNT_0038860807 /DNA_START=359 /DNA_END=1576 /DNA_ORIENTATION=-
MTLFNFSLLADAFIIWSISPMSFVSKTNGFLTPISRKYKKFSSKMVPVFNNNDNDIATSTTTATIEYDWSFLDGVYLITCPNADPGGRRLEQAREILEKANLWDMVEIKAFDTDDEDRIRGCYTSHISVLEDAKKKLLLSSSSNNILKEMFQNIFTLSSDSNLLNSNNMIQKKKILVLEDNIGLTGKLDVTGLQAIRKYVESDDNEWDVMHLAYIPYVPSLVVSPSETDRIVQLSCGIGSALGTTAYIIQDSAIEILLRQDREQSYYAAIPDVMAELFPDTRFAAFPTPFLRAPKIQSLVNPQLDDLREILFQPIMTLAVQTILAKSGISTNQLLPLTILSLLLISLGAGKMSWDSISSILQTGIYDGSIPLAIISFIITIVSLAIIVQGIWLAPEPSKTAQIKG